MIGQLVAWPLEKMPQEIWTGMTAVFIPYMAQTFDGERYPLLAQLHPSLTLPADMRGEFVRGWDNGRAADNGRALLSAQKGSIATFDNAENTSVWGALEKNNSTNVDFDFDVIGDNTYSVQRRVFTIGANTVYTLDSSNGGRMRPRNITWNYIVRAS